MVTGLLVALQAELEVSDANTGMARLTATRGREAPMCELVCILSASLQTSQEHINHRPL